MTARRGGLIQKDWMRLTGTTRRVVEVGSMGRPTATGADNAGVGENIPVAAIQWVTLHRQIVPTNATSITTSVMALATSRIDALVVVGINASNVATTGW